MTNVIVLMWVSGFVHGLSMMLFMIGAILAIAAFFLLIDNGAKNIKEKTYGKWCAIMFLVFFSISIILPNKATMNMIVAASATEALASTELGQKGVTAINVILDDIINRKEK